MTFNLDNLAAVLSARGLKVVETAGWQSRGYAGQDMQPVRGVLWHHTATNRAAFYSNNAPTLSLCINGRSDLPGPLANIVFGRDGTCYIVATGVANHAGTGRAPGVPVNMGNHYLIGIEMESSGIAPWDWTAEMLEEAPKLGAALELAYLQGIPESERLQIAHYEYSDAGKIDPAGWPGGMDGLRASINNQIAAWSNGGTATPQASTIKPIQEDDLMATPQQRAELINELLDTPIIRGGGRKGSTSLRSTIAYLDANLDKLPAAVLDGTVNKAGGGTTNLRTLVAWMDANLVSIKTTIKNTFTK